MLVDGRQKNVSVQATYHATAVNQEVIDMLSVLPAKAYKFAPDILCVVTGCAVRLIDNIDISAGLVISATGSTVVKVIYNNADVQLLIDGKHPPPYCIAVEFSTFHGFSDEEIGK